MKNEATFSGLIDSIRTAHQELATRAGRAVNISLTLRNWLIGYYIEEYERNGVDRAEYGEKLMDHLSSQLTRQGIPRCDRRELYRYRQFYLTYPQIVESLPPQLQQIESKETMDCGADESTIQKPVTPRFEIDGDT
jgi:hypothetical protein